MVAKKQKKSSPKKGIVSSGATKPLQIEDKTHVSEAQGSDSAHASEAPKSDSAGQPTSTTDSLQTKSGGKRGVCAMYKVIVRKARGKKFKVSCNELGAPTGSARPKLQSYVGYAARSMIPIDIPSWPHVDPELKSKLWQDIQDTFKVKARSRDSILKFVGVKWRQFKTRLTRSMFYHLLEKKRN